MTKGLAIKRDVLIWETENLWLLGLRPRVANPLILNQAVIFAMKVFLSLKKLKNRCRRHQRKIFQAVEITIFSFQKQKSWSRSEIQRIPGNSAYRNPNFHQSPCKLKGWGASHSHICVSGSSPCSLNE